MGLRSLTWVVVLGLALWAPADGEARRRRRPPAVVPLVPPPPTASPQVESPAVPPPPPRAAAPDLVQSPCAARLQQRLKRHDTERKKQEAHGQRMLTDGRYGDGARVLSLAYAREPRDQVLYDLARALHQAEKDSEALLLYQRYLQEAPSGAHRTEAESYLGGLKVKLGAEADRTDVVVQGYVDAGGRSARSDYDKSIEAFATIYAMTRIPQALFNLGQGHRRAGRSEDAYLFYRRFLAEDDQTPLRRETEGYLDLLGRGLCTDPPLWRRPWFWAVLSSAVAVGVGVTLGVTLSQRGTQTDAGVFDVHF